MGSQDVNYEKFSKPDSQTDCDSKFSQIMIGSMVLVY